MFLIYTFLVNHYYSIPLQLCQVCFVPGDQHLRQLKLTCRCSFVIRGEKKRCQCLFNDSHCKNIMYQLYFFMRCEQAPSVN